MNDFLNGFRPDSEVGRVAALEFRPAFQGRHLDKDS
jgi:hypothetical protein